MSTPLPLDEKEQSELVAYLDGELQGEAARSVEAKLSHEPAARAEADALKRTWDLLDFLPKPPEPSPNFTHRTMEKLEPIRQTGALKKIATGPTPTLKPPARRWPRRLLWGAAWIAAATAAGFAGYWGFNLWAGPIKPGERELVRELPLIENKRLYDLVEDKDELREIGELFGEEG